MGAFAEPAEIAALMAGFDSPWFIAGGWAIDLFLGRVTRDHADVEVAILRADQHHLRRHLAGWTFRKAIPGSGGKLEPWLHDEWLSLPIHELHASRHALLYKAAHPRDKDEADFDNVRPVMDQTQRKWLTHALVSCCPGGHPWVDKLAMT